MDAKKVDRNRSFMPFPEAHSHADEALRNLTKLSVETSVNEHGKAVHEFATNVLLVDIGSVDATKIDFRKVARDCELLRAVVEGRPHLLGRVVEGLQRGGTAGLEQALEALGEAGLTEDQVTKEGGGLLWLLLIVVALAGCATMAPGGQANKSPAAGPGPIK